MAFFERTLDLFVEQINPLSRGVLNYNGDG